MFLLSYVVCLFFLGILRICNDEMGFVLFSTEFPEYSTSPYRASFLAILAILSRSEEMKGVEGVEGRKGGLSLSVWVLHQTDSLLKTKS